MAIGGPRALWFALAAAGAVVVAGGAYYLSTRNDERRTSRRRRRRRAESLDRGEGTPRSQEAGSSQASRPEEAVEAAAATLSTGAVVEGLSQARQELTSFVAGQAFVAAIGVVILALVLSVAMILFYASGEEGELADVRIFWPLVYIAMGLITGTIPGLISHREEVERLLSPVVEVEPLKPAQKVPKGPSPDFLPAPHGVRQRALEVAPAPREIPESLKGADQMYDDKKFTELYTFLKEEDRRQSGNAEVLWRLSRATYEVAELQQDAGEKKNMHYSALEYAEKAIEADSTCAAGHKWKAITLGTTSDFLPTKEKISNAFKIKEAVLRAIELDPTDPASHHILGRWCWALAGMTWIEKRAAAALFGAPPEATYEEALQHFLNSERLKPGSWKMNSLMIAKVYQKLNNKEEARTWLQKSLAIPIKTAEDQTAHNEASAFRI